jgi:hypothetical protein
MVHSIELLFDDHTDAALRRQWEALAEAGLPSQARISAPTNRPHVTLAVAERIDEAADNPLGVLADRLPLDCVVGAPLLFGGGRFVLTRLIVPTQDLLALHAGVHETTAPHMTPGPAPHSSPGHWTPHTTMCRRLTAAEAGRALATVHSMGRDLPGRLVALRHWDGDRRAERVVG